MKSMRRKKATAAPGGRPRRQIGDGKREREQLLLAVDEGDHGREKDDHRAEEEADRELEREGSLKLLLLLFLRLLDERLVDADLSELRHGDRRGGHDPVEPDLAGREQRRDDQPLEQHGASAPPRKNAFSIPRARYAGEAPRSGTPAGPRRSSSQAAAGGERPRVMATGDREAWLALDHVKPRGTCCAPCRGPAGALRRLPRMPPSRAHRLLRPAQPAPPV